MKPSSLFAVIVLMTLLYGCSQPGAVHRKKILMIYAHPDDETSIGPVVAKLAKQHDVTLITMTNGGLGYREHAGIPKGDSLAAVRKKELQCSCKALGIDSLITLEYNDGFGLLHPGGIKDYFQHMRELRTKIPRLLSSIAPDLIITFGPDGDSGHSDHRLVSAMVTETLLSEGWVKKYPLYYAAWTKAQGELYGGLGYVADDYLNVKIHFTNAEEQQYFQALRCHWSQYSEEELRMMIEEDARDTTNTMYLRKFAVAQGQTSEFP